MMNEQERADLTKEITYLIKQSPLHLQNQIICDVVGNLQSVRQLRIGELREQVMKLEKEMDSIRDIMSSAPNTDMVVIENFGFKVTDDPECPGKLLVTNGNEEV